MSAMSALLCDSCMTGAIHAEATHLSQYGDGYVWCANCARPGDKMLPSTCQTCGAVESPVPTCHPHPDLTDETIEQLHRRAFPIPRMAARPTTREGER